MDSTTVDNINSELLIPHTLLGYWESHGTVTLEPKPVYDSVGNLIGNYLAHFYYDGQEYTMPCSGCLGGVVAPPYGATITTKGGYNFEYIPANYATYVSTALTLGKTPIAVTVQITNGNHQTSGEITYSDSWTDLSFSGGTASVGGKNVKYTISGTATISSLNSTYTVVLTPSTTACCLLRIKYDNTSIGGSTFFTDPCALLCNPDTSSVIQKNITLTTVS
jgi:hypothetical protein